jgi:5'(3')-deoxyribonucleotidase
MRDYREFYREAKGDMPRIYVDMDGVLCDFVLAAKRATGQDWTGLRSGQDWESIRKTKNYWANMPWTRDGRQLWNFIKKYQPHILSAYSIEDPNCIPGKRKWLKSNIGYTQNSMINIVRRREKQNFAKNQGRPAILIDDYPKNVQQFKSAGGIGIVHTSTQNTISQLKRIGF